MWLHLVAFSTSRLPWPTGYWLLPWLDHLLGCCVPHRPVACLKLDQFARAPRRHSRPLKRSLIVSSFWFSAEPNLNPTRSVTRPNPGCQGGSLRGPPISPIIRAPLQRLPNSDQAYLIPRCFFFGSYNTNLVLGLHDWPLLIGAGVALSMPPGEGTGSRAASSPCPSSPIRKPPLTPAPPQGLPNTLCDPSSVPCTSDPESADPYSSVLPLWQKKMATQTCTAPNM